MNMSHYSRSDIQADQSQPPRQPLPEKRVVTVKKRGMRNEAPGAGLQRPFELDGQTTVTRFARRVLHS